jgi:circadian clock protein KaiC
MANKNLRPSRVSTGIQGLDLILGGGLPKDRLYLLQGDPGVGKTTLSLQFLLEGLRRNERCLYVTLGETKQELEEVAGSHQWDLSGIAIYEVQTSVPHEEVGQDTSYDVFHPAEVELGEVMRTLLDEAERVKPTRVVIDSLSELRLLARDPLRYRRQLLALKNFFIGRGATVLLLDAGNTKAGDLQSNTLVHGVIVMEQELPRFGLKRRRLNVLKLRGVKFDDGYHDYKIETGGLQVFPRLVAAEHCAAEAESRVSSGLPELDESLGGGLPTGTSTILLGAAGVGKSTLVAQYASTAAASGGYAAIFTFDESARNFVARSEGIGLPVKKHVDSGKMGIVQVDPGALSPGEFSQMVRDAVERRGATVVAIDSLTGYLSATPDERFLTVQLHELLSYLGNKGVCTLLVVAQHGILGQGTESSFDASFLSDAIIYLRYFEHEGVVRKAISIVKKRTGGHEPAIHELEIGPGRVRVGRALSDFQGVLTGNPVYTGTRGPLLTGGDGGSKS